MGSGRRADGLLSPQSGGPPGGAAGGRREDLLPRRVPAAVREGRLGAGAEQHWPAGSGGGQRGGGDTGDGAGLGGDSGAELVFRGLGSELNSSLEDTDTAQLRIETKQGCRRINLERLEYVNAWKMVQMG